MFYHIPKHTAGESIKPKETNIKKLQRANLQDLVCTMLEIPNVNPTLPEEWSTKDNQDMNNWLLEQGVGSVPGNIFGSVVYLKTHNPNSKKSYPPRYLLRVGVELELARQALIRLQNVPKGDDSEDQEGADYLVEDLGE